METWNFEADYFTACNCDWGCPCNFNAPPTEGRCMGLCAWHITTGRYGDTPLDDTRLALYYRFPGPVDRGDGMACAYIDPRADVAQREALERIGTGQAGGGLFELFGRELVTTWLPTKIATIEFELHDGLGRVEVEGFGGADSELLSYPDGSTIRPSQDLPHGIEFKRALMTNAKRWWWRDDALLAGYDNKYGAVAKVRFTEAGCVG